MKSVKTIARYSTITLALLTLLCAAQAVSAEESKGAEVVASSVKRASGAEEKPKTEEVVVEVEEDEDEGEVRYKGLTDLRKEEGWAEKESLYDSGATLLLWGARVGGLIIHDTAPPERASNGKRPESFMGMGAVPQLQFSLMQVFIPEISLAGEIYGGPLFFSEHTLSFDGYRAGGVGGTLGADLTFRYHPFGLGFLVGLSLGGEWIFMHNETYTSFAPTARIGYGFELIDKIGQIELFFKTPVIGGLSTGIETEQSLKARKHEPTSARLYQFGLSMAISF